jgi:hypothetical protein
MVDSHGRIWSVFVLELVAVILSSGCGSAYTECGVGGAAPAGDSAPPPRGSLLPASDDVRQASAVGPVESVVVEPFASGLEAARVVIAGDAPVDERSFLALLPPDLALPFAVGDRIALEIETVPGPPTWQPRNVRVTTEGGELLAMGGVLAPEGWSFERAGEVCRTDRGDYAEVNEAVVFGHGGVQVTTHGGIWQTLVAPDGTFRVRGSASRLEGDRLPPDGGPTSSMMIVRER